MRSFLPGFVALFLAGLVTHPATAQGAASATLPAVISAQMESAAALRPAGATLPGPTEATPGAAGLAMRRGSRAPGEVLMLVGAAGIVTGLLIDEDVVTIAGAAVGGYGLYLYLR